MFQDVFAHARQGAAHRFEFGLAHAGKRLERHLLGQFAQPLADGLGLGGQRQTPRAAVSGIALALDQPGLLEPVDDPARADRLDIEPVGELDLLHPGVVTKRGEHAPLGTRHAKLGHTPVVEAPHRVRGLANLPGKFFHNSPYNKRAY